MSRAMVRARCLSAHLRMEKHLTWQQDASQQAEASIKHCKFDEGKTQLPCRFRKPCTGRPSIQTSLSKLVKSFHFRSCPSSAHGVEHDALETPAAPSLQEGKCSALLCYT